MAHHHLSTDTTNCSLDAELVYGLIHSIPQRNNLPKVRKLACIDRWILASALQKCIRRGLCDEAINGAVALHMVDAEYAWRRLRVIALEDIGLGDVKAVGTVMAISGKRQVRRATGDLQLFVASVHSLAVAVKDRTACDLICWIDSAPEAVSFRANLLDEPSSWESVALDGEAPMWWRVIALQLLAGFTVRTRSGYRTLSRSEPNAVRRIVEELVPDPLVAFTVLRGKGVESLNIALLFAYLLREAADFRPLVSHEAEARNLSRIGGVIAPSFCMYTRVGLRALRMFLHRDAELRCMLNQAGVTDAFKALGLLVFQVESGVLDRFEDYAPKVRMDAERAELAQFGVTDAAACAALRMTLKEHLPMLNKARQAAWKAHVAEVRLSRELA
ncbi:MAG: hypothetical protein ACTHL5_02280 [Rhodanobacter sp.]